MTPVTFMWQPADRAPAEATRNGDGSFRVGSDANWGRVSGVAGPIALPASVQFRVAWVNVRSAVRGNQELATQGFATPYGFFAELGLRAERGHAFAGTDLQRTLWTSVNAGMTDVFGMLRAVGQRPGDLSLDGRGRPVSPHLKVFGPGGGRSPGFTHRFDSTQAVDVLFDLKRSAWECQVTVGPQESGKRRATVLPRVKGRWADLGLREAPAEVWAWAHAGNWAEGRGDGAVSAQVGPLSD